MKTYSSSLLAHVRATVVAVAIIATSSSLHAATFDWTGAVNGSWAPASGNWSPNAAFGNTADLSFNTVNNGAMFLNFTRTARSLSFGADIDSDVSVSFNANNATGYVITMSADSGNPSLNVAAGALGNVTLGLVVGTGTGSMALGGNLDVVHNGSGLLNFNRAITGSGFGINKTGTGTMMLNSVGASPNTFSGDVNINEGRLIANGFVPNTDINNAANVNLGGGVLEVRNISGNNKDYTAVDLHVTSASTLAYNNTNSTSYTLTFSGANAFELGAALTVQNISVNNSVGNAIIISRNITGAQDMIVRTYNNVNSGTANFGLGRVALGGDNSAWLGDLVIREGTAEVFGDSALGRFNVGAGDIILGETDNSFGAGFLLSASTTGAKSIANNIIVRSGGFRTIRGTTDNSYTLGGNITLEGDLNLHNGLQFTDKNMIFTGDISGVGGLSITESGNPNFTRLTGNNTYSGATSIGTGAVLNILSASGNAIGDSSAVTFAGAGSVLQFNSTSETIGSLASSGTDGTINLVANTLTTGGNNSTTTYGGAINGTGGGLTKAGTGEMTLTGASSYTGATLVSNGTLKLDRTGGGSISGTASVSVNTGGKLLISQSEQVNDLATITLSGGAIERASGMSETFGDLTLTTTGTLDYVGGTAGTLEFGAWTPGSTVLTINNFFAGNMLKFSTDLSGLISTTAGSTFNNANFSINGMTAGGFTAGFDGSTFTITSVPEPSTVLAAIGLSGLMLWSPLRRRFVRKK